MQKVRWKDSWSLCQVCACREALLWMFEDWSSFKKIMWKVSEEIPVMFTQCQVQGTSKIDTSKGRRQLKGQNRHQRNNCSYQQSHTRSPKHVNVLNRTSLGLIYKTARSQSSCLCALRHTEQYNLYPEVAQDLNRNKEKVSLWLSTMSARIQQVTTVMQ